MMSKRTTNAAVGRAREAVILHTTSLGAQTCRGFFYRALQKENENFIFSPTLRNVFSRNDSRMLIACVECH